MVQSAQALKDAAKKKADAAAKKASDSTTPSEDTAGNPPVNNATGKTSLGGMPLGMDIQTGKVETKYVGSELKVGQPVYSKVQYTTQDPYKIPATMSNQDKANLLLRLALIPNLYGKGEAPTQDYIRATAATGIISFRPEDYAALTKVMIHADTVGQSYDQSIQSFLQSPALADQYFGKITPTAKKISTSSPDALYSDMNSRYKDMFDAVPDKKTLVGYAKTINKMELAAGGSGNVSASQREDVFLKYVEDTAMTRYKDVLATPDTKDDAILEKGALGQIVRSLRSSYFDNGIPSDNATIYKQAVKGVRSKQALTNVLEGIQTQASIQYPAIKDWIAKGNTARSFFTPYISSFSRIYGVPVDQVDISKFANVAAGTVPVTVAQWEKDQWKNPDIKKTQFYKDTMKNDLRAVTDAFGIGL